MAITPFTEGWNVKFDAERKRQRWLIKDKQNKFVPPTEDNVRLIAAAPEMFHMLRCLTRSLMAYGYPELWQPAQRLLLRIRGNTAKGENTQEGDDI